MVQVSCRSHTMRLAAPFVISRGARVQATNVFIEVDEGRGAGTPIYYLGQTIEAMERAYLDAAELVGDTPGEIGAILDAARARHPDKSAWLCALDLALHDLAAKRAGTPLWRMLHGRDSPVPATSYTVSLGPADQMLAQAAQTPNVPVLKVKCGGTQDLEALRLLAREDKRPIRVDANGAWDLETTREMLRVLPELGVELIEQPLPVAQSSLLRPLLADSPLPIVLDESIQTGLDVLTRHGHCHGINIKLSKCGGIMEALRMIEMARAFGLKVMLGCMIESSLVVAATAHLSPLVDWVDLDGHLWLADDPYRGLVLADGRIALPQGPGLGVAAVETT